MKNSKTLFFQRVIAAINSGDIKTITFGLPETGDVLWFETHKGMENPFICYITKNDECRLTGISPIIRGGIVDAFLKKYEKEIVQIGGDLFRKYGYNKPCYRIKQFRLVSSEASRDKDNHLIIHPDMLEGVNKGFEESKAIYMEDFSYSIADLIEESVKDFPKIKQVKSTVVSYDQEKGELRIPECAYDMAIQFLKKAFQVPIQDYKQEKKEEKAMLLSLLEKEMNAKFSKFYGKVEVTEEMKCFIQGTTLKVPKGLLDKAKQNAQKAWKEKTEREKESPFYALKALVA